MVACGVRSGTWSTKVVSDVVGNVVARSLYSMGWKCRAISRDLSVAMAWRTRRYPRRWLGYDPPPDTVPIARLCNTSILASDWVRRSHHRPSNCAQSRGSWKCLPRRLDLGLPRWSQRKPNCFGAILDCIDISNYHCFRLLLVLSQGTTLTTMKRFIYAHLIRLFITFIYAYVTRSISRRTMPSYHTASSRHLMTLCY